jgi:biopolymer transport protein ExbB/TolQ
MKNFLQKYLSLILLTVLIVISLTTLFRVPKNLKQATEHIANAEQRIDSSMLILKQQTAYLDSLMQLNEELLHELDTIKQNNAALSESVNAKLNNARWYLQKIKTEIEKFPEFDEIE